MKRYFAALLLGVPSQALAGAYAGPAGEPGSTAIEANDRRFQAWATGFGNFTPGPQDVSDENSPPANFGSGASALGPANARLEGGGSSTSPQSVVSLGDGGSITLLFAEGIADGEGDDFAVFENAFNDTFLELAFVEVSSDGEHFVRLANVSLTPTGEQIDQTKSNADGIDATDIDGFAGKYRVGFGTPFDLRTLAGTPDVDLDHVTQVRLVDVVGSIDSEYARFDSAAEPHVINDPWPTPFATSGFDLDAIGVLNVAIPEPAALTLLAPAFGSLRLRRRRG